MTYRNFILTFVLITTLGIAAWTTYLSLQPHVSPKSQPLNTPDAIMEDVSAVIMDKFGKPKMKILTPKLVHYDNDTTDFIAPQLTLYRKSPEPWFISSKRARATEGVDNVSFFDEVTIHHAADGQNPATVIKTTTLTVHTDKETAETADSITLTQPNITIQSIGMFADMDSGDIKLLSAARGEYVPTS